MTAAEANAIIQHKKLEERPKQSNQKLKKHDYPFWKSRATKQIAQQPYITDWHFEPFTPEVPKRFQNTTKTFKEEDEQQLIPEPYYIGNVGTTTVWYENGELTSQLALNGWREIGPDIEKLKCPDIECRIFYRLRKPVAKIEPCYPTVIGNGILKKSLTEEIYSTLVHERTFTGASLEDCIRPGLDDYHDLTKCGVVACDEECYYKFRPLFESVVQKIHPAFSSTDKEVESDVDINDENRSCAIAANGNPQRGTDNLNPHRGIDLSNWSHIEELPDYDENYVEMLEIEVHRNLRRYKFSPRMNRAERRHVKDLLLTMLEKSTKHRSTCMDLSSVTDEVRQSLEDDGLFPLPTNDLYDISAGLRRDWPDGRAIWLCDLPRLTAHLNVVDHLVIIARNHNGHLLRMVKQVGHFFHTLKAVLSATNESFADDSEGDFGYLTTFPELLGAGVVCRAKVRLENLTKDDVHLTALCDKMGLIISRKETNADKTVLTLETKYSLGYDDEQLIDMFAGGIERLLKLEIDQSNDDE